MHVSRVAFSSERISVLKRCRDLYHINSHFLCPFSYFLSYFFFAIIVFIIVIDTYFYSSKATTGPSPLWEVRFCHVQVCPIESNPFKYCITYWDSFVNHLLTLYWHCLCLVYALPVISCLSKRNDCLQKPLL